MSDAKNTDKPDGGKAKGKGKGLIVKLLLGLVLIGAGGGGAFALVKVGMIGGGKPVHEDNTPKLLLKGEKDPFAPPAAEGKGEAAGEEVHGDGGSPYRTAYFSFGDDFTANLKGSQTLIQISLACSTQRDGRVLAWLKVHELAIRSAMLAVLTDTTEDDIATPEGKAQMQQRLTAAINKVLIAKEGFGGVDSVYFKSFIIQ
jgi:flagellar protein FliL